jgi:hypothetical protein
LDANLLATNPAKVDVREIVFQSREMWKGLTV